jgi:iron(II)-dependent oxidoreductase
MTSGEDIACLPIASWVAEARTRTLELVDDLSDEELIGPRLSIVNPLHWEIGHVAWFQEHWALRHAAGLPPVRTDGASLYDSAVVPHDTRWDLPLPPRGETLAYLRAVRDRVLSRLAVGARDPNELYFVLLSVFHEDMHDEAFSYTRQTLGYPPPRLSLSPGQNLAGGGPLVGDVGVPGGTFCVGASRDETFVFDNEKWAHPVDVQAFRIARAPITQEDFARFVDEGGYRRDEFWSVDGLRWRQAAGARHPVYWRAVGDGAWLRRHFDRWVSLEPHRPVIHVNWYEAEAWCRWAGRRLPTEVEWEVAAAGEPDSTGSRLSPRKRRFPWGDTPPSSERAALDWSAMGCVDVGALPDGDSAFGCRHMIGNVWEWTSSDFMPYPGFERDPYKEYSEPWFRTHKVLRGGGWTTRARLLRNTWRNFYTPDRRDVWAGFRTCALDR